MPHLSFKKIDSYVRLFYSFNMTQVEYYAMAAPFTLRKGALYNHKKWQYIIKIYIISKLSVAFRRPLPL